MIMIIFNYDVILFQIEIRSVRFIILLTSIIYMSMRFL